MKNKMLYPFGIIPHAFQLIPVSGVHAYEQRKYFGPGKVEVNLHEVNIYVCN